MQPVQHPVPERGQQPAAGAARGVLRPDHAARVPRRRQPAHLAPAGVRLSHQSAETPPAEKQDQRAAGGTELFGVLYSFCVLFCFKKKKKM